jgi:hypothetical protein
MSASSLALEGMRFVIERDGAALTGNKSPAVAVMIPSMIFDVGTRSSRRVRIVGEKCFAESAVQSITIPRHVKVLCSGSFHLSDLVSVSFESGSQLTRIESDAFRDSGLTSVTIPHHVEILGSGCFARCESLSSISFDSNSKLKRIESKAFF